MIQTIVAVLILILALAYLVNKFLYPLPFFNSKKDAKNCGNSDCGCS
ncbi:FeoB-associated Cys-rich membrane protein [Croceivirga radicis]|nr:FeoB-associated Cys-rich membrane protein [Croceivirga radicis]